MFSTRSTLKFRIGSKLIDAASKSFKLAIPILTHALWVPKSTLASNMPGLAGAAGLMYFQWLVAPPHPSCSPISPRPQQEKGYSCHRSLSPRGRGRLGH